MAKWRQRAGIRTIGSPFGFRRIPGLRMYETQVGGSQDSITYELEKRRRHPGDQPDTGYYLYGGSYFGEWCGVLLSEAVDEAQKLILEDKERGEWQ